MGLEDRLADFPQRQPLFDGRLGDKQSSNRSTRQFRIQAYGIVARISVVVILLNVINYSTNNNLLVQADESATTPPLDLGVLASLATNLGSNPQIMSLVSNLLNPTGSGQTKPSVGSVGPLGMRSDLNDMDSNAIDRQTGGIEPLRRGTQVLQEQQQASPGAASEAPKTTEISAPPSPSPVSTSAGSSMAPAANPLGNIMSMLPGVLSGLPGGTAASGGSLNIGALTNLLGLNKNSPGARAHTEPGSSTTSNSAPMAQAASGTTMGPQQVISQVLAAFASGQIPSDLIQLGLSGRIPPQIIELALSGQVPADLIKMVITGQVPMATINAFLSASQPANGQMSSANASGQTRSSTSSPGVFSTTRALFEALVGMGRSRDQAQHEPGKPLITVPTLIGPIPLKMPSMPSARSFGQLVGGTISNFSSMIPF